MKVPWYGVLGNHEYGYNVSAQLDLTNSYPNWVMPDRYYVKRVQLSSSNHLTMIFLVRNIRPITCLVLPHMVNSCTCGSTHAI